MVKTIGNHTLKFGADARQYRMNFIVDGNSTGTYSFANTWVRASSSATSTVAQGQDLASLLLGLPTAGSYDVNSFGSFYNYYTPLFVQDDWRVRRNLTVNFGLHFDHDGAVHEKYGRTVDGFDATDLQSYRRSSDRRLRQEPHFADSRGRVQSPRRPGFRQPEQ